MSTPTQQQEENRMSFVEMEQNVPPEQEPVAAKKPARLHHLDWLRAMCITFAVFLHCWQIFVPVRPVVVVDNAMFPVFDPASPEYALLNQGNADWRETDYSWRYIMMARQFVIPLLFWISGCSLGLGKGMVGGSIQKVGLITLVGCIVNGVLWAVGPNDTTCSYAISIDPTTSPDQCNGLLIDWVIAPGAGIAFGIVFQFWFTVFMMIFLGEVTPLWNALRETRDAAADSETWSMPGAPMLKSAGLHWVIVTVLYIAMSFWIDEPEGTDITRLPHAIYLALMEIPFIFFLLISCGMPASSPGTVRMMQYLAAVTGLIQFTILQISKEDLGGGDPPLDGRYLLYFHMFRQMMTLGYVQMLTRSKTAPIMSRIYPVMLMVVMFTAPFTNYFRGGVDTYPFLPRLFDRLLYTGGSWIQCFIHDRLGNVFADTGLSMPLPSAIGFGALLAYMFHPVAIVLGIGLWTQLHPMLTCVIITAIFCVIAELFNLMSRRNKAE